MNSKEKQSRSDMVASHIRGLIFSGELEAGTRLIEQDIAKEFGMSRGPVREALQKLEHEGLLIAEVNKGCTVARLSGEDAYEIFFLRGTLEKIALEKCGGRLLDSSIMAMRNIVDDMNAFGNLKENMEIQIKLDDQFHKEILKSAKMPRLLELWNYMSPMNGAMFLKVLQVNEHMNVLAEKYPEKYTKQPPKNIGMLHESILNVLEKGNLEESLKVVEEHYFQTGEKIYRLEQRNTDM